MEKLEIKNKEMGHIVNESLIIAKINEIVEVLNGITKLIDYADNERKRDKE